MKELADSTKEELFEGLAHAWADNYMLKQLLKNLGSAFSDEVVDKENGNYLKIKVDDIPEEMIEYID